MIDVPLDMGPGCVNWPSKISDNIQRTILFITGRDYDTTDDNNRPTPTVHALMRLMTSTEPLPPPSPDQTFTYDPFSNSCDILQSYYRENAVCTAEFQM